MRNPIEDFVEEFGQEKTAIDWEHARETAGDAALSGLALSAFGMGMHGMGVAASKIYDAATKSRDFKSMMEFNQDLQEHHDRDPRMFNQMFTSLRTMNPHFSKDPVVAGTYMRRMVENPMTAGGILTESLNTRDKFRSPFEGVIEEGTGAARSQFLEGMKKGPDKPRSEVLPGRNPMDRHMREVQGELEWSRRNQTPPAGEQPTGRHPHVGTESPEDMRGRSFSMDERGRPLIRNNNPDVYRARR